MILPDEYKSKLINKIKHERFSMLIFLYILDGMLLVSSLALPIKIYMHKYVGRESIMYAVFSCMVCLCVFLAIYGIIRQMKEPIRCLKKNEYVCHLLPIAEKHEHLTFNGSEFATFAVGFYTDGKTIYVESFSAYNDPIGTMYYVVQFTRTHSLIIKQE